MKCPNKDKQMFFVCAAYLFDFRFKIAKISKTFLIFWQVLRAIYIFK